MPQTEGVEWAVIGAGPAGIATVGKLLDNGVAANAILWLDPTFAVGDFGMLWAGVPSNTKVKLFTAFLQACAAFQYDHCEENFLLHTLDPDVTCELRYMVQPLQWVTQRLLQTVTSKKIRVEKLHYHHQHWHLHCADGATAIAKQVVLAIGAEPKLISSTLPIIPLHDAMDAEKLPQHCDVNDTIAVFGSSHSAILVLKNLVAAGVTRIINFYRSPLRYAVYYDTWILFDDTGLKGTTAEWARHYIDGDLPVNLERVEATDQTIQALLPQCDKMVVAIGFERRSLQVDALQHLPYEEHTGIIGPGLFGVGIAFPEAKINPLGMVEYRVGLWKFMEYLERVMPVWLSYSGQ